MEPRFEVFRDGTRFFVRRGPFTYCGTHINAIEGDRSGEQVANLICDALNAVRDAQPSTVRPCNGQTGTQIAEREKRRHDDALAVMTAMIQSAGKVNFSIVTAVHLADKLSEELNKVATKEPEPAIQPALPELHCHKCGYAMTTTPICIQCGTIPVAEHAFAAVEKERNALAIAMDAILAHLRYARMKNKVAPETDDMTEAQNLVNAVMAKLDK
jgi:hypothetical protein